MIPYDILSSRDMESVKNFYWMAGMMRRGYPLPEIMESLSRTSPVRNYTFKKAARQLREGADFSETIKKWAFIPPIMKALCVAGEKFGVLPKAILLGCELTFFSSEIKNGKRSKFFYCILLMIVFCVTSLVISIFVFPVMQEIYALHGSRPHWSTRFVIHAESWIRSNFLYILVPALLFPAGLRFLLFLAGRWRQLNSLIGKIPFAGPIYQYAVSWKLCLITGSLLKLGVPLPDAVATVGKGLRMPLLVKAADRISAGLDLGKSPEVAIGEEKDIPDCVRWAAELTHKNDDFAETLIRLGETYRKIERETTDRALSIIVVISILLISALIFTTMLLPVYMPVFTMVGTV